MQENKPAETPKKPTPKKHIIPDKADQTSKQIKMAVVETKADRIDAAGKENQIVANSVDSKSTKSPTLKASSTKNNNNNNTTNDNPKNVEVTDITPGKLKPKRHSFINDFAALEKTYRMLGIQRESTCLEEDEEEKPAKKRHASEGKAKKKTKAKAKFVEAPPPVQQKKKEDKVKQVEAIAKPKLDAMDKGMNEQKRNFFQDIINEKKGLVQKEVALSGPKMRKKTNLVSNFEEKTKETNKRSSLVRDDVKVRYILNEEHA